MPVNARTLRRKGSVTYCAARQCNAIAGDQPVRFGRCQAVPWMSQTAVARKTLRAIDKQVCASRIAFDSRYRSHQDELKNPPYYITRVRQNRLRVAIES